MCVWVCARQYLETDRMVQSSVAKNKIQIIFSSKREKEREEREKKWLKKSERKEIPKKETKWFYEETENNSETPGNDCRELLTLKKKENNDCSIIVCLLCLLLSLSFPI